MFSIRRILHPTDFSRHSDAALQLACSLARDHGAEILLVHVAQPATPLPVEGMMVSPVSFDLESIREELRGVPLDEPAIKAERRLLIGDPANEILQLAKDKDCDLIVLGSHGRTGLRRLLMGSVAERIVREANCPVLTVKCPAIAARAVDASTAALTAG